MMSTERIYEYLIDSHCHLDILLSGQEFFKNACSDMDSTQIMQRAMDKDVAAILNPSVKAFDIGNIAALADKHANVFFAPGVHPCNCHENYDKNNATHPTKQAIQDAIKQYIGHPKAIALGETGLDYYRGLDTKFEQQESFCAHLELCKQHDLPVIVHTRAADADTISILKHHAPVKGVIHCFSTSRWLAEQAMEMGMMISFSGIVTFKNASEIQDVAKDIPDDFLLLETDTPYLAPVPFRGRCNEPANTHYTAKFIAERRQQSYEHIMSVTSSNFFRLFDKAKLPDQRRHKDA